MAYYYKPNKKVAEYLDLSEERNTAKDGNYLLWECDMERIGPEEYALRATGAVRLTPMEAKMEFTGEQCQPLNVPADPRFIEDKANDTAENPNGGSVSEEVEQEGNAAAEPDNDKEE